MPIREAVLRGAQDRVRPILMTTATTMLALTPMALSLGEGAQLRAPMAIAVIAGLFSSTMMSLLFIPWSTSWSRSCGGDPKRHDLQARR